jgi:hypothetical protein
MRASMCRLIGGRGFDANFLRVLASPAVASKRWIFEQYDYMVRTNTLDGPGAGDAAVLRVKPTRRALALCPWMEMGAGRDSIRAWERKRRWRKRRATWPARARGRGPRRIA